MAHILYAALRRLAAVAAAGALCGPAPAAACATIQSVAAEIQQESPEVTIRIFGDRMAGKLRAGISILVGQDVPLGGEYLLADFPGAKTSYIVRFEGGCATHHGRFPNELVQAWLEGSPA